MTSSTLYTETIMAPDVAAIQRSLRESGLEAWLLYDFHGANPISLRVAGITGTGHLATRRWYYLIPAHGQPKGLVHRIEGQNLDHLPGEKLVYAGRAELDRGLTALLAGVKQVAMEYSPECAIPYVSRVDAGTIEAVRARGVEVVSSGDLVQQFEAAWTPAQLASHRAASEALHRIKDRAFAAAADAVRSGRSLDEFSLQQQMWRWFDEEGLDSDSPPVVAVGPNASSPHYLPTRESSAGISADSLLLLDLWGKRREPGSVFADITWVGYTGRQVPERMHSVFAAVARARDAAVSLVQDRARAGQDVRGWEADRVAHQVLVDAGFGEFVAHRTGHSLGENVHGNGAHLDDYETHDERRLLPGTGFTVEPGLYVGEFGVRSEINVYRDVRDAIVTGPRQEAIVTLV
jgi:Xaa-Pro aminopeptidase